MTGNMNTKNKFEALVEEVEVSWEDKVENKQKDNLTPMNKSTKQWVEDTFQSRSKQQKSLEHGIGIKTVAGETPKEGKTTDIGVWTGATKDNEQRNTEPDDLSKKENSLDKESDDHVEQIKRFHSYTEKQDARGK